MKVLSLFSGIGAFEKALERLNINYELVGFSEIDKYATKSYCAIHGVDESQNLGDITKINETELPKDIDLITYGFPCQDISNAGKMQGLFNDNGTRTRSGLFFDALRIIEETKPEVAIAENVKNLTSKKFSEQFNIVLDSLDNAGYNNYWKVLNSKDFGVPQNRERVFIVSIRKDIDKKHFKFPDGFPLELRLRDILETKVDEKFYINETALNGFIKRKERNKENGRGFGFTVKSGDEIAPTILARYYKDGQKCLIAESTDEEKNQSFVTVREATKKGYAEAFEGDSINLEHPNSKTRRGRVGKQVAQTITTSPQQAVVVPKTISFGYKIEPKEIEVGKCITARYHKGFSNYNPENAVLEGCRLRRLIPKECFRLQDFDDKDFEKAAQVNSDTQLYKQAGNTITVAVVQAIIKTLIAAGLFLHKQEMQEDKQ